MDKAAFSLESYEFEKIFVDYSNNTDDIRLDFLPSGTYFTDSGVFRLKLEFIASDEELEEDFVRIECNAEFEFEEPIEFDSIPRYFYTNCIAIIFPYIRAFISTLTLQANIAPVVLPTLNLSRLAGPLEENTVVQ